MSTLPIATTRQVRRAATALVRADGRAFAAVLALNAAAALLGLAGPWLLGRIIDRVADGATTSDVDRLGLLLLGCALAQLLTGRQARYLAHRFGERSAAKVREQLLDRVLALPAATAERAGTGDLTARGTADSAAVGETLRDAAPELLVAGAQVLFILGAILTVSPLLGSCGLIGVFGIALGSRWYLRRSRPAYLADRAATADLAEVLAATAHGARTVDALGLREQRLAAGAGAVGTAHRARMRTLYLRLRYFAGINLSYTLPSVLVLPLGAVLVAHHAVTLGAAVSTALYLQRVVDPLDNIVVLLESLQSSTAAYARVEGLAAAPVPAQARAEQREPADDRIRVTGVHHAYPDGPDVLHGLDLDLTPGERLAVVGPSGSGKTTLGRLLAGLDRPRAGTVTVGGVPLADLSPERLRRQVVLVTQEHHVFLGTLRDNLRIAAPAADDAALTAALDAVGWQHDLPAGLDTELGPAATRLDGARAQQLALARVILADPHTLVLDEATALLDPATARHTERALAATLTGRTVIAIAHRLHTAHDADRVAVLAHGRLTDLGPHEALLAAEGPYAALWHTWRTT
ncbi:ABC transporter ATP-binding protein [Kitasatospora cineracea]|uniref:ATP-binding cassette subfamily C protein n=1 Tax=Kitasatospora cineracea TaxID=88074 RepID=A0A8G1UHY2_9ACTN|nr:ABC transporter ATP-binding protein [Kitasatospora cineracea]ROR42047.1 ATP-binding cassette subfamily C protein [Kitasatospora cineracea]